jgi:hypothetical protein
MTITTETIKVWADDGGTHYAEGHHDPEAFMTAVNALIDEFGVRDDNERSGVTYDIEDVTECWYQPHPTDTEGMIAASEGDPGAFPVTLVFPMLT